MAATKGNVSVTTASGTIIAANPKRNGVILVNEGTDDVWLGFGEAAEVQKGAKVPAGGSIVLNYEGEPSGAYDLFRTSIKGIVSTTASLVAYQEI
jgi:type II secretory pathway component PulC